MVKKGNNKSTKQITTGKRKLWPYLLFICIVSISLYYKSTNNQFLDLDDTSIVVKNYPFLKNSSNVPKAFTQGVFQLPGEKDTLASFYRPVMTLSFMIDAQLSHAYSPNPKQFLKSNIFYHTLACILILLLLLEFNVSVLPAFLLTLIFAVHPLLNQAVVWIPGRNDSLLTIFILLSLISLLRYRKTKNSSTLVLHILFFVIALFTKENAVIFIPVVFILLRFVYKEPFSSSNYKTFGIAYLLCIIPWFLIRQHALMGNNASGKSSDLFHVFFTNIPYFLQYTGKAILPFNLSVMSSAADTNYLVGLLAVVVIAAAIYLSKEKNKGFVILGIAWFYLFLTPSFFSGFTGLEHRAYLPLVGALLVASQFDIIKRAAFKPSDIKHLAGIIILAFIVVVFYITSTLRLPIFQNKFDFDKSAIETSKTSLPCLYLAKHYEEAGDSNKMAGLNDASDRNYNLAIDAYKQALQRDSTLATIHSNIAGEYIRMSNYPEAEKELTIELSKYPNNPIAVFNYGLVIFQAEHKDSLALLMWKKSISMDSSFAQPYKVLSQYYQAMGDSNDAILYRNFYIRKSPKQ